jgi:anaerobic dimethyl sulfoxide reductase subunit B (iron-sulfur subunit)
VEGGGWKREGEAWVQDVYAYSVSMACNHCERPICVEVCPAAAILKRPDGIVLIDSDKCLGCEYCGWACPYGALQYDAEAGHMTKCDLCADSLDNGSPPSCVAACPMRALDYGERDELEAKYGEGPAVHPLPSAFLTEPALFVTPHKDAARAGDELDFAKSKTKR